MLGQWKHLEIDLINPADMVVLPGQLQGGRRKRVIPKKSQQKTQITTPKAIKRKIAIDLVRGGRRAWLSDPNAAKTQAPVPVSLAGAYPRSQSRACATSG